MPKSKRDKKVSLTKTNKKGLQLKQKTIEEIRNCLTKYEHIFLFTVDNMRNAKLKDLRHEWKDSRFFFGKNKVMAIALGRTKSDEVEDQLNLLSKKIKGQCGLLMTNRDVVDVLQWFNDFSESEYARSGFVATEDVILPPGPLEDFSHTIEPHLRKLGLPTSLERGVVTLIKEYQLSKKIKGQCGLLMTNRDVVDVLQWFNDFSESEYARSGFVATEDVILPPGPLEDFSHTIEPHLRKLGLPTSLERGVVTLIKEYQVCKKGAVLTPEQASILKLLGRQLAEFKVTIKCHWSKGKGFHKDIEGLSDNEEDDDKEENVNEDEEMEEDET